MDAHINAPSTIHCQTWQMCNAECSPHLLPSSLICCLCYSTFHITCGSLETRQTTLCRGWSCPHSLSYQTDGSFCCGPSVGEEHHCCSYVRGGRLRARLHWNWDQCLISPSFGGRIYSQCYAHSQKTLL
ncbi:hypothetical protein NPIL_543321 [Nephila pilipes]|uniref:Uncharacterized protein n=1 Tax=Nephila pilipes TaxID=299642 RepID=A0A8X6Q125_NEPPI|nr:hypothetical protein NPIL_543321 [Nephila pilipes]